MNKFFATLLALALIFTLCAGALAEVVPQATPDSQEVAEADEWLYEEDVLMAEENFDPDLFDDVAQEDADIWDDEDNQVEDTLMSAMEVYSWFVLYPLDVDYDKPNAAGDRYQVLDERFNTMDALRDMVSQYFSDDIVEDLFSMGVYTEEDGYLYTTDEGRQMDVHIGETEFELTEETGEEKVYTVTVNYWGEEDNPVEVLTYVQQLIDGQWKFTQFPFYW